MNEIPSPAPPAAAGPVTRRIRRVLVAFVAAVLGLLALLYGFYGNAEEVDVHGRSAVFWMVRRWSGGGGDLSHGWLIPLLSLYALWRRRTDLARAERKANGWGLLVIVLSLLLHWVGLRSQQTRLSLLSLVGLLWGLPFFLLGWQVARRLIFPCAFLIFCIPLSFLNDLTLPLRLVSSRTAALLLNGVGIPTECVGTAIHSSAGKAFSLDVADACSGLRSVLALTALAAVYAHLTQRGLLRQWALFLSSIPLAVAGNVVRVVTIALVAVLLGTDAAMKVYHHASGFIVFIVATGLMMAVGHGLNRLGRARGAPPPAEGRSSLVPPGVVPAGKASRLRYLPPGVALLLLAAAVPFVVWARPPRVMGPPDVRLDLPAAVGPYHGEELRFCQTETCQRTVLASRAAGGKCPTCGGELDVWALAEKRILPADTLLRRRVYLASSLPSVQVSLVGSGVEQKSIHRPQQCLPAQGFVIERARTTRVPLAGRDDLEVRLLSLRLPSRAGEAGAPERRFLFAYWFVGAGRETASHYRRLWWMTEERLFRSAISSWVYFSLLMPCAGEEAEGLGQLREFVSAFYPQVSNHPAPAANGAGATDRPSP